MPPVVTNGEAKDALGLAAELTAVVVVLGNDRTDVDKVISLSVLSRNFIYSHIIIMTWSLFAVFLINFRQFLFSCVDDMPRKYRK